MTSWQTLQYGQATTLDNLRNQNLSATTFTSTKRKYTETETRGEAGYHAAERQKVDDATTKQNNLRPRPHNRLQASRIDTPSHNAPNIDLKHCDTVVSASGSTPGISQNPQFSLRHPRYGLPVILVDNFERLGVHSIYPWQSTCLLGRGLLEGEQNLIYTAPTGGGKSLVADVLMLRRVINNPGKKAILVLPYVALVQEKMKWLRSLVENVHKCTSVVSTQHQQSFAKMHGDSIQIAGFFGGNRTSLTWSDCDIAVCTIEKANGLVNSAIEEGQIDQLGIVVLDELHMLDDENRGYILELMATKLMCFQIGIQIVGMSATLSNPKLLADWLQAKFYVSKYRPVAIQEYIVYDGSIYSTSNAKQFFRTAAQLSTDTRCTQKPLHACKTIDNSPHVELKRPITNAVVSLAVETAVQGFGALVFCGSRHGTENMALLVSDAMPNETVPDQTIESREDVLASLRALPNGFDPALVKTVQCGVGFHHAGLTVEERSIIADAFDSGFLKVLVATCSLAAGINLPARRVILNGARMGRELVGPAMLRQMRGRAGRKGKDEIGETYLCCVKDDLEAVAELLEAEMPAVTSCLTPEKRGIKRAVLEVLATRLATSRVGLEEYIQKSLLWQIHDHHAVLHMLDNAIADLLSTKLISQSPDQELVYEPTQLGTAIVASGLTPDDGIFVHTEMRRALASFVMDGEMHTFYLFTPIPPTDTSINWPTFRDQLEQLPEPDIRAMRLIGISPSQINKIALSGATHLPPSRNPPDPQADAYRTRIHQRAYMALQLRDLCNEVPIHTIAAKFSVARGHVQTLSQTSHGFASGMIKFCSRMGSSFSILGVVLEHTLDRLRAGARADLLEMAQVTHVKSRMARILWENGFKSVRALAEAGVEELVPVMMRAYAGKLKYGMMQKNKSADDRTQLMERELEEQRIREKVRSKAEVVIASANWVYGRMMTVELEE